MLWELETTFSGLCFQEGRSPKKAVATSKDEHTFFKQSVVQICLWGPQTVHIRSTDFYSPHNSLSHFSNIPCPEPRSEEACLARALEEQ